MLKTIPLLMLTTTTTTTVWILAAVFCSLYPKPNTEIQHGSKYKVHALAKRKIELWMLSSWLFYRIKLIDSQLPTKALTYFNATQMFPWSRIEYKLLSQNLWICYSRFTLKNTKFSIRGSMSWFKTFKKPAMIFTEKIFAYPFNAPCTCSSPT